MWLERTYKFAVQEMLFDHDNVDGLGIFEGEKAETARTARGAITHHLTVDDIAKL